jgi:hypothetical protein
MLTKAAKLRGARAGSARTVELSLSDGSSRRVDIGPLLWGPVFVEIAEDDAVFAELSFDPELGTVCWPNGADIAPEALLGLPDVGSD